MRHKHADLIIAWANGSVLESNDLGEWRELIEPHYIFKPDCEYRIKPKEPEWWENIPEHGVLARSKWSNTVRLLLSVISPDEWTPLTNEEIERLKR
jgi:hypothetical protein